MGELTGEPDTLRSENRRLRKEVERLERDVRAATALQTNVTRVPGWTNPKRAPKGRVAAPVLVLSDWHFGEVVDPREMDGFNAYDDDIAQTRWQRVISEVPDVLHRHLHGYGFPFGVVALIGDMLSGDIHDELARTNYAATPEVIMDWIPRIAAGLQHLADSTGIDRWVVPCVDGNHDRDPIKRRTPAKQRAVSSFTWIIYNSVALALGDDDRFTFAISRSPDVSVDIFDQHHLFVHGDGARGGGGIGGIWPPIMRYVTKLGGMMHATGRPVDHVVMGHWHQYTIGRSSGPTWLVNGSGKGFDEYARSMAFPPERPQQAFYAVAPDRGIIVNLPIHAE